MQQQCLSEELNETRNVIPDLQSAFLDLQDLNQVGHYNPKDAAPK